MNVIDATPPDEYDKRKYKILDESAKEDQVHIIIRPRRDAPNFSSDKPWAAIQIGDVENDWPKLNYTNLTHILQLHFPDREFVREAEKDKLFNASHADKILDFFEEVSSKTDTLMIHCYAGQSRSPAIGAALSKIHYNEDKRFFDNYMPNQLVYNAILKRHKERTP